MLSKKYGLTDVDGRRPGRGTFFPRKVQEIADGDEPTEMDLFIVRTRILPLEKGERTAPARAECQVITIPVQLDLSFSSSSGNIWGGHRFRLRRVAVQPGPIKILNIPITQRSS